MKLQSTRLVVPSCTTTLHCQSSTEQTRVDQQSTKQILDEPVIIIIQYPGSIRLSTAWAMHGTWNYYSYTLELKICFLTMVSEIMEIAPMKLHDVVMQTIIIMILSSTTNHG